MCWVCLEDGGQGSELAVGGKAMGVKGLGWGGLFMYLLCSYREAFTIPLIPLGLKETKEVDFSVVLKVNLKQWAPGSGWKGFRRHDSRVG